MGQRDRKHLFVQEPPTEEPYKPPGAGGRTSLPDRDRASHSQQLRDSLQDALNKATARRSTKTVPTVRALDGIYAEFESAGDTPLPVERLGTHGATVLSIKREGNVEKAAVFMPQKAVAQFLNKFDRYRTTDTKKGRPSNEALVSPIETVGEADLRSLWTDDPSSFPATDQEIWWEVWLCRDSEAGSELDRFRAFAAQAGIQVRLDTPLSFPERTVLLIYSSPARLASALDSIGDIAELRSARPSPQSFLDMSARKQSELTKAIADQIGPAPPDDAPAVCLLDTGVNAEHRLLQRFLSPADTHVYDGLWNPRDLDGHGTSMGGLALFGDLFPVLAGGPISAVPHRIESVKFLPDDGQHPPELYGFVTRESLHRAEVQAPNRRRVISIATTTRDFRERGRPSSWSAELDTLAAGAGESDQPHRLFAISAGNAANLPSVNYLAEMDTDEIHDPAQAWNVLTVGAYTEKVEITEHDLEGYKPLAPPGTVSPWTTTSVAWDPQWPLKPEIVLEGGNLALSPREETAHPGSLCLISTSHQIASRLLTEMWATSAATAQAARLAAIVQAEYPSLWPETARALIVHSAEWTQAMRSELANCTKSQQAPLLRRFGYGVPDLSRARFSANNALTLVAEETIAPVVAPKQGNEGKLGPMHTHRLPWPTDVLRDLGDKSVKLRVTLSYFVEPNPGERGWRGRYRYASHGLRFKVKGAYEDEETFRRGLNKAARDEDEDSTSVGDTSEWQIGPQTRNRGSVHSDIWEGTAADLAERGVVGIFPVAGWWKSKKAFWGRKVRYSLVVSIETAGVEADIYTPVLQEIESEIEIDTD